jgi:hypothetical protein
LLVEFVDHAFTNSVLGLPPVGPDGELTVAALGLYYDRNNLLINGDIGFVPSSVWGTVVSGLESMAQVGNDMRCGGMIGETLLCRRITPSRWRARQGRP